MRFLKSLLSSLARDQGSAITDFVLVITPISLMLLPLISLFALTQSLIADSEQTSVIARFAALADVSDQETEQFRKAINPEVVLQKDLVDGCQVFANYRKSVDIYGFPVPLAIELKREVVCEVEVR